MDFEEEQQVQFLSLLQNVVWCSVLMGLLNFSHKYAICIVSSVKSVTDR
jgi:hypothetical protein